MTTAIVISDLHGPPPGHKISLKGPLFTDDIRTIWHKLIEFCKNISNTKQLFQIDISSADTYSIKPYRLVSILTDFSSTTEQYDSDIIVELILNNEQKESFELFEELKLSNVQFTVVKKEMYKKDNDEISTSKNSIIFSRKNILVAITYFILLLSVSTSLIGLFYYFNSLRGFLLFYCGGILSFESIVILWFSKKTWSKK